jgi:hypothetical protein
MMCVLYLYRSYAVIKPRGGIKDMEKLFLPVKNKSDSLSAVLFPCVETLGAANLPVFIHGCLSWIREWLSNTLFNFGIDRNSKVLERGYVSALSTWAARKKLKNRE